MSDETTAAADAVIDALRDHVSSFWAHMDAVGWTIHPCGVGDMYEIARLLHLPESDIPTEARAFRLGSNSPTP